MATSHKEIKKTYFIPIPKIVVKAISEQLKISNPPNITDVEDVILWCVSSYLTSDPFSDYKRVLKDSTKILEIIREETKGYIQELKNDARH